MSFTNFRPVWLAVCVSFFISGCGGGGDASADSGDSPAGSDETDAGTVADQDTPDSGSDRFNPDPAREVPTEAYTVSSGEWTDPDTWSNGLMPGEGTRTLISQGTHLTIDPSQIDDIVIDSLVVHGVFEVTDSGSGAELNLAADWMHVNGADNGVASVPGGALFRMGSESDRFDSDHFTLTLAGTDLTDKAVEMVHEASASEPSGLNNRRLMTVRNNDGFLMVGAGGRLQLFGQDKLSFTKLAQTAERGATQIVVHNVIERNFTDGASDDQGFVTSAADDGTVNWEVGDTIAIASTEYDYQAYSLATITDISDSGNDTSTFTLDRALPNRHYGEQETYQTPDGIDPILDLRAEVALLNRNIRIQGLESQDTDSEPGDRQLAQFKTRVEDPMAHLDLDIQDTQVANGIGANIMIMGGAGPNITVDGVQLHLMGQASRQARYPFHWHLAGDRDGDLLRNTLITNSNNRGVVVHGTGGVRVEGVTLFDIHGHGFFLEDGVEVDNDFIANLTMTIHNVGGDPGKDIFENVVAADRRKVSTLSDPVLIDAYKAMNRGFEGDGEPRLPRNDPFIVDTHDQVSIFESRGAGSAGFWITNPDNRFIGNINAGAFGTGYWYILPRMPLGLSAQIMANTKWSDDASLTPTQRYLKRFLESEYANGNTGYSPNELPPAAFEYNTSHSTPTGLTIFRGMDIENGRYNPGGSFIGPDGDTLDQLGLTPNNNMDGFYRERPNNRNLTFTGYRSWKSSGAATYLLYGGDAVFENAQISDSMMGLFAPTVSGNNSLLVGHSKGNADKNQPVSLITFYDSGNRINGSHIAGLEEPTAHLYMMDKQLVSSKVADMVEGITFEPDGSRGGVSIGTGYSSYEYAPRSWSRSVIDVDGSLTGTHPLGNPGALIVPDTPFMFGGSAEFHKPNSWGAYITSIPHARLFILVPQDNYSWNNDDENWSVTSPEGTTYHTWRPVGQTIDEYSGRMLGTQFNVRAPIGATVNDAYTIDFSNSKKSTEGGKIFLQLDMDDDVPNGDNTFDGAVMLEIANAGPRTPTNSTRVTAENDLNSVSGNSYYEKNNGNLLLKVFVKDDPVIELEP